MKSKICSKCGEIKNIDDFENDKSKKDLHRADCRTCSTASRKLSRERHKEKNAKKAKIYRFDNIDKFKEKDKNYYHSNKEKILIRQNKYSAANKDNELKRSKKWYQNNKEKAKNYNKKYRSENAYILSIKSKEYHIINKPILDIGRKKYYDLNKDKIAAYHKNYRSNNKDKRNKLSRDYCREKRKINPEFKVLCNLRSRIYSVLRFDGAIKSEKTIDLIGCGGVYLIKHLESKFLPGMTWDNYGRNGWHIDHDIPCASFNLTNKMQQKECFHYSNLQPLWWIDNIKKGAKHNGINYRGKNAR